MRLFPAGVIGINNPCPLLDYSQYAALVAHTKMSSWSLLFTASQHNFSAAAFHQHCDGKGPTITVVKAANGRVFGGYTSVSWAASGGHQQDPSSVLFACGPSGVRLFRIKPDCISQAVYHYSSYGPTFGVNGDMYLSNQCHSNTSSDSNLPHSFTASDGGEPSYTTLAGSNTFTVAEYQVFAVKQ